MIPLFGQIPLYNHCCNEGEIMHEGGRGETLYVSLYNIKRQEARREIFLHVSLLYYWCPCNWQEVFTLANYCSLKCYTAFGLDQTRQQGEMEPRSRTKAAYILRPQSKHALWASNGLRRITTNRRRWPLLNFDMPFTLAFSCTHTKWNPCGSVRSCCSSKVCLMLCCRKTSIPINHHTQSQ